MPELRFLKLAQVGEVLNISDAQTYALVRSGDLPAIKIGGRGARLATTPLPPPPAGTVRVERRVPRDGVVMVTRQRVRVGRVHAGKLVTILVEDTHLRVLHNGEELALHARTENRPIARFKAYTARQPAD